MPAAIREPLTASWAQACHAQHGHLDWIDQQCSPLTCELERLYDWAALYGVDRLMATAASGQVIATGNIGTRVLANTLLRGPNGLDYIVPSAVDLGAGNTAISVRCQTTGAAGNLITGQVLSLIDPIPGCNSSLTVSAGGMTGGAEDELVDDWRARVTDEWRVTITRGARSGKPDDYRFWARSAHPSVTGALVQPHALGTGTVLVRPICNGLPDRQPTEAVLAAVAAYFYIAVPATADWRLAAPIRRGVGVSIHLLPGFDTLVNRSAIEAALNVDVLAEDSETSSLGLAEIDADIATVTDQYVRIAPIAEIAVGPGEVLVLDPVVWS
jgi:uncharacterized phage protein gp47/JayE